MPDMSDMKKSAFNSKLIKVLNFCNIFSQFGCVSELVMTYKIGVNVILDDKWPNIIRE